MSRRTIIAFALTLALAGCGGNSGKTTLVVDVSDAGKSAPDRVVINIFDDFGLIGTTTIAPAQLPGKLTVAGLPDQAESLRVVAVGDGTASGHQLGGVRIAIVSKQTVTAPVTLSSSFQDGDNDDVPDGLDDCPLTPDPLQTSTLGDGVGDVCRPDGGVGGDDLSGTSPGDDLAVPVSGDMAGMTTPVDMAKPLVPPDMAVAASACPAGTQAGVVFCEGFEQPNSTLVTGQNYDTNWYVNTPVGGATATIDTTRFYRGKSSLHFHTTTSSNEESIELDEDKSFTGAAATHLYARAFIYVATGFPTTDRTDFLVVGQNATPYTGIRLEIFNDHYSINNVITGAGTEYRDSPTPAIAYDRWTCVEWEVNMPAGTVSVTSDGTLAGGFTDSQTLNPSPPLGQFAVFIDVGGDGLSHATRDLWIDELIIDSAPVGCTK